MTTVNIGLENIHPNFVMDDIKVLDELKKITDFYLKDKDVISLSCLNDYDYQAISFDVMLCDNNTIKEINNSYRSIDKPTDVITFAIFADSVPSERFVLGGEISLGEIILSLDKVQEQAQENGHSFESELYFLLAHGFLHCLGFEHKTEETYKLMMDLQNRAISDV